MRPSPSLVFLAVCPLIVLRSATAQPGSESAADLGTAGAQSPHATASVSPGNPAAVSGPTRLSLGVTRLYGTHELVPFRIGITVGDDRVGFGVGLRGLALPGYRRLSLRFSGSRCLVECDVRFGLGAETVHYSAGPYPGKAGLTAGIGGSWRVQRSVWAGLVVRTGGHHRDAVQDPAGILLQVAWGLSPSLEVLLEAGQPFAAPGILRWGLVWTASPAWILRAGGTDGPTRFALGVGLPLRALRIDLAGAQHDVLGWTLGIDLTIIRER